METNKNDKYIISIKGLQTYEDDNNDTDISLLTEGDFEFQDGVYFIDYEESELTGLEGTSTSIEIGSNYVSLQRSGTVNTNMLFMKDRKTSSYYNTPYGDMQIDIFTDNLNQIILNFCLFSLQLQVPAAFCIFPTALRS